MGINAIKGNQWDQWKSPAQPGVCSNVDAQPGVSSNVDAQPGVCSNVDMQPGVRSNPDAQPVATSFLSGLHAHPTPTRQPDGGLF
eukprot:364502-Chlamydomonas_euryale.AAC.21